MGGFKESRLMQNVSRETFLLQQYSEMLRKWQKTVQLVAPSDLAHLHKRHFEDCRQYATFVKGKVIDLGSGGGLPAVILAIMGHPVKAVESDKRKAAFLQTVAAELNIPLKVLVCRAENIEEKAMTVTARAMAPLPILLSYAEKILLPEGRCIFPKGAKWDMEVSEARQTYDFVLHAKTSLTHPEGRILVIEQVKKRQQALAK